MEKQQIFNLKSIDLLEDDQVESFSTISSEMTYDSPETSNKSIKETYKLKSFLGFGANAVVRKAMHQVTGEFHAIKIFIKAKTGWDENKIQSISREVEILRSLDHRNIVEYIEFFHEDDEFFLVTEKMDMDLYDFMNVNTSHFTESDIKMIFREIAEGINYCHQRNIIHKDIKPENILVNIGPTGKVT